MAMQKLNKMDIWIAFRRGLRSALEAVATVGIAGQAFWTTDTKQLFVHDGTRVNPVQTVDMLVIHDGQIVTHNGQVVIHY